MDIGKPTCGRVQSQCKIRGFLLLEVMIALGLLVSIGSLFYKQYASILLQANTYERSIQRLVTMASVLEQELQGIQSYPPDDGILYKRVCAPLYTEQGELLSGCELVTVQTQGSPSIGTQGDYSLTTVRFTKA